MTLLEARGLAKSFGAVVALRSADLSVDEGEIHALMGANGAGKSTLVKVLTGALRADGGEITIRGQARSVRSPAEARRAGLVPVYQDPALVPDLTVRQNLRLTRSEPAAVRPWLGELGLADLDLSELARDLPQASLRLVDLARALASEPELLLLDEISAALPVDVTDRVFSVVRRWREKGCSVIYITHRLAEVSALCDRATVLRDGVTVGVVDPAAGGGERIVSLMLGPAAADVAEAQAGAETSTPDDGAAGPSPVVLEVRDLSRGTALRGVTFNVHAGEVLGVAALRDQGQQELFDCLAGVQRPDAGEIVAGGRAQNFRHPADAIRSGLTLVPADRLQALLRQRSVRENIALPLASSPARWGPINMAAESRQVTAAIQRLQIDTRAQSQVRRLSGGNQQKVTVARWLAGGFRTLLCFDPTRGIDIGTKRQIYALVRELAAQGHSVLLFTSELPEIQLTCDRVLVLFGGRVVRELSGAEADEATLLRAAHGLTAEMAAALDQEQTGS